MRTLGLFALMLTLSLPLRLSAQLSPGPLARAHQSLEGAGKCASCHGVRREPMTQLCLGCHKEIRALIDKGRGLHARQAQQGKRECASCHPDHAGTGFAMIAWDEGSSSKFDHARAGWPLDGKHREAKCESCHATRYRVSPVAQLSPRKASAGWIGLETTCISCHREDDAHNGKLDLTCESCHNTTTWDEAPKFEHQKSDYPLTGKHADVECDACHLVKRLGLRSNEAGQPLPVFKPVPHRDCVSCHSDPHKGQMTAACSECHVTRGFSIIDKREFNHAATRYPLRGKHAWVGCEGCHGKNLTRKTPPFATCASCHSDPHRGEATIAGKAQDCASCHRVEGFTPATFTVAKHRQTAYPLEGKHASVACVSCHTPGPKIGTSVSVARMHIPFSRCSDCHSDAHAGQLDSRPKGPGCESCHAVVGFAPSTFSVADHAKLRLPLDGRHATTTCAACHASARPGLPAHPSTTSLGTAKVALTLASSCTSCHVDAHAGRFPVAASGSQLECTTCHTTTAFHPSTVDIARHNAFAFKLEGAHRAVSCAQCHSEMTTAHATSTLLLSARNVAKLPFAEQRTRCASCHETPHGTQFAARKDAGECAACHAVDAFAPASRFNHNRDASFKIEGAHAKVLCGACHQKKDGIVSYRGLSAKCESCHGSGVPRRPA